MQLWRSVVLTAVVPMLIAGCATRPDREYPQAQRNEIETMIFQASFDDTFTAVVVALFEARCMIRESDKRAGFLRAWGPRGQLQVLVEPLTETTSAVRIVTSSSGQSNVDQALINSLHDSIAQGLAAQVDTLDERAR